MELVLRSAADTGLQNVQGEFTAGEISFELQQLGDIGLIPGRNMIFLPFTQ